MKRLLAVMMMVLMLVGCGSSLKYNKGDSVRFNSDALEFDFDMVLNEAKMSGGKITVKYTVKNLHEKPLDPSTIDWITDDQKPTYETLGGGRLSRGESTSGTQVIESASGKWKTDSIKLYPCFGYLRGDIDYVQIKIK